MPATSSYGLTVLCLVVARQTAAAEGELPVSQDCIAGLAGGLLQLLQAQRSPGRPAGLHSAGASDASGSGWEPAAGVGHAEGEGDGDGDCEGDAEEGEAGSGRYRGMCVHSA